MPHIKSVERYLTGDIDIVRVVGFVLWIAEKQGQDTKEVKEQAVCEDVCCYQHGLFLVFFGVLLFSFLFSCVASIPAHVAWKHVMDGYICWGWLDY